MTLRKVKAPTASGQEWWGRAQVRRALGRVEPSWYVGRFDASKPDNIGNIFVGTRPYGLLIEQRRRASEACGHADWLRCRHCQQYEPPENITDSHGQHYHPACSNYASWRRRRSLSGLSGYEMYLAAHSHKWAQEYSRVERAINRERKRSMFREGRRV